MLQKKHLGINLPFISYKSKLNKTIRLKLSKFRKAVVELICVAEAYTITINFPV